MRGKIEGDGEVAKGAVTEKMGGGGRGRMGKGKKERKAKEGESRERKTRYRERISGKKEKRRMANLPHASNLLPAKPSYSC